MAPRTPDEDRPTELLDRITAYFGTHSIANLSLRPLAKAVGTSPRVLLYYFGSKEELIEHVLARLRERQRVAFDQLRKAEVPSPREACRLAWQFISAPQWRPHYRLFFEIYALALRDPARHAEFLHGALDEWLDFIAQPALQIGIVRDDAYAFATIVLSGFRGFLLDLCASEDETRVNHAVEIWFRSIDLLIANQEFKRVQQA